MNLITFSRKLGSGGREIAQKVADKLGYKFHDTEAIEQAAREMGFLQSVREIDEKVPSFFQRLLSQRPTVALDRLSSVVYELAKRGDSVFLGRGSHMLLRSFDCGLHVKITASKGTRIRNLIARGYQEEAAAKAVERSDHERSAFIKFAFGVDWDDPGLYDLVISTDKVAIDSAVRTVTQIAQSDEMQACSADAIACIDTMGLKYRVDAAIIEAGFSYGPTVVVSASVPEPGKVELSGLVEDEAGKVRIEEVVKGVKGVLSVQNKIHIMPATRYA